MLPQEVNKLIGPPRSTIKKRNQENKWNYGTAWIIFEGGVVSCIVKSGCQGIDTFDCDFSDMYGHRKCIIK